MRRDAKSITTSPDIVKHIEGLAEATFKLLTRLIQWSAENEKRQRRYRYAVIHRLTQMEAAISLILVEQQAHVQRRHSYFNDDKLREQAKAAEEFISKQSHQQGMNIITYIYGEDPAPEPRHDRRRGWWGWEI